MKTIKDFEPKQNFILLRGIRKGVKIEIVGGEDQNTGVDKFVIEKIGPACSENLKEGDEVVPIQYQDQNGKITIKGADIGFGDEEKLKDNFVLIREQEIMGVFKRSEEEQKQVEKEQEEQEQGEQEQQEQEGQEQ